MLQKLSSVQKLDIFGFAPAIQFNGGAKSYSHFGLIYTLITGAFVLWAVIFTSQDFVNRTNPSLITTTLYGSTVNEDIVFDHESFQLGFGIYENFVLGNYFIDPSIYTVTARMGLFTYYPDGTCLLSFTPLNIEPCQESSFDGNVAYYESQWCLSKQQDHFDKLYTRAEDDSFIQVDFHFCNNATSGGNCASPEVMKKMLTDSDVMTTFKQSTTIASNYKEPISSFYTDQWQGLLLDKTKSVKLMIDVVEFTSDDGWLFQSETEETILNFNSISGDALDRREEGLFATFIIANSGNKVMYHRTYMKIQDVLAQVSGLAGAAALILGFFAQPFAELKMYEKAVKEVYKIKVIKKKTSSPSSKSNSPKSQKTQNKKIYPSSNFNQSSISPDLDETVRNNLKSKSPVSRSNRLKKTSAHSFNMKLNPLEPDDFFEMESPVTNTISPKRVSLGSNLDLEDLNNSISKKEGERTKNENDIYNNSIGYSQAKEFKNAISIDLAKEDNELNESDNKEENEIQNSDIGYFQWLLSHIRFSPQVSLLKRGQDEINKYLDVLVLVKKMREIDKLKACLMKKEEKIIFENIQQPVLSIDTTKGRKLRETQIKDSLALFDTAARAVIDQAHLIVRNTKHKTQFGEKLLMLYEQDKDLPPDLLNLREIPRGHRGSIF